MRRLTPPGNSDHQVGTLLTRCHRDSGQTIDPVIDSSRTHPCAMHP
ncbi:MAG: hypothetical protein OEU91_02820 [Gammaproteobacteria bacterium]|nr:hypothetical protein [Gammaproteobacteria bacterium]